MKKCSFIGLLTGLAVCAVSFSFISCGNIFDGSTLKTELENKIEYEKSASYNIRVAAKEGTGTITAGSGDHSLKVTDRITISFSKADGYRFLKWQAVKKSDEAVLMTGYISFEDETALETVARFEKAAEDILIKPLCEETIVANVKTPVDDSKNGVEKDSAIKLRFTYPLSENNDLSRIKITVADPDTGLIVNGASNFNTPELIDDQLLIMPNMENRISVTEGKLKTVTVTIPSDFLYKSKNGEQEISYEISHTYTINSNTSDKAFITFGTNIKESGSMQLLGVQDESISRNYSIGATDTAVFTVDEKYRFLKWDGIDDGAIIVTYPKGGDYDEKGYNAANSTATINIRVINSTTNGIAIRAVTEKIPTTTLKIDSAYGKLSPSGNLTYKEGDKVSITFNADSDYQFIKWRVLNKKTGAELTDQTFITFENAEEFSTSFTLKKVPEEGLELKLEPYCIKRPKVVSASPIYDTNGVFRDRTIVVMFDKEMDEKSIYWTKTELEAIEITDSQYTYLEAADKKDSDGNQYYYGYVSKTDESDVTFKNISISDLSDQSINLLKYYKEPAFDKANKRVLRIMTKTKREDGKIVADAPAAATEVLVTINNDFYAQKENKEVSLSSEYSWVYYTNKNTDSSAPVFNHVNITIADVNQGSYDSAKKVLAQNKYSAPSYIKDYNITNGKIWIDTEIQDEGSGPGKVVAEIVKVDDTYYPLGSPKRKNVLLEFKSVAQQSADCSEMIDVSDLTEGLYELYLISYDKNEHLTYSGSKYFVYDNVAPSIPEGFSQKISDVRKAADKTYLSWQNPQIADLAKCVVTTEDISSNGVTKDITKNTDIEFTSVYENLKDKPVSGLKNQHKYKHSIKFYDYAGNVSNSVTVAVDNTAPNKASFSSGSRPSASSETVNWSNSSSTDFDHVVVKRYEGSLLKDTYTQNSKSTLSYSFRGLENQHKYTYYISAVDYSGNESGTNSYQDDTAPGKLIIRYTEGKNGKVILHYTTPSDVDYAKTEILCSWTDNGTYSDYITGLGPNTNGDDGRSAYNGSEYPYYFKTYDYSGNTSGTVFISEKAGAMPGMICYAPENIKGNIFCSKNYWSGKNPIGVVCNGNNQSNVYIWGIGEVSGKPWGNGGDPRLCGDEDLKDAYNTVPGAGASGRTEVNCASGLRWYNYLNGTTDYHYKGDQTRTLNINWSNVTWSNSIWNWCRSKNNNSAVTWFIPGVLEFRYILDYYDSMTSAYNTLASKGYDGTIVVQGDPYWVGSVRYYNGSAYAVEFNYRNTGDKCDWEYFTNSSSTLKRMWMTSTEKNGSTFTQSDTEESYVNIRAHAMAIINMN